jgi:predicted nucleotidyltransferase
MIRAEYPVEEVLGVEADLMTRDSLHPALRERIEAAVERVH